MKPFTLFLAGSLLGVCITVATLYARGPITRQVAAIVSHRKTAEPAKVNMALRSTEASIGSAAAPITLVEFSDFQCVYCKLFRLKVFPDIKIKFIDTGKLRFVHRHLPLESHSKAKAAAHAAVCAGDQKRYWDLSEIMFSRSSCLECQGVMELSKSLDLDRKVFESCMSSNAHMLEIEQDMESARDLKIEATPSFVLGRTTSSGVEGVVLRGLIPFAKLEAHINTVLN